MDTWNHAQTSAEKAPSNDNSLRQALSLIGRCFAEQAEKARKISN